MCIACMRSVGDTRTARFSYVIPRIFDISSTLYYRPIELYVAMLVLHVSTACEVDNWLGLLLDLRTIEKPTIGQ